MAQLIPLILKLSIIGIVFALGLKTPLSDVVFLLRKPGQLIRSVLAMNFLMPLVAGLLVLLFHPPQAVGIALICLSLAPVPPLLPGKFARSGGDQSYGASLMAVAALVAIVTIPISMEVIQRVLNVPLSVTPVDVIKLSAVILLAPLALGLLIHQLAPGLASKIGAPLGVVALVVLLLAAVVVIAGSWRAILGQIGDGALIVFAIFVAVGLVVGHLLGGPAPTDRTVLALATASRHPGIAIGIAHIAAPNAKAVMPLVILYLLVSVVVSIPYVAWRKKSGAAPPLPLET